jgi:hypothetical protein
MLRTRYALAVVSLASASALASGYWPVSYDYDLRARANLLVNPTGSFNVPHGSTFNSTTVSMNASGAVASKISSVGGTASLQGIFYAPTAATGGVATVGPDIDTALWSDVVLGDSGRIALPVSLSAANGIYFRDPSDAPGVQLLTNLPAGATSFGGLTVRSGNVTGFRANVAGNSLVSFDPAANSLATHASQTANGYSFIFTPHMNNPRLMVARVTNPAAGSSADDQVRTFSASGQTQLIVSEGQSIPDFGIVQAFESNPVINDVGDVAVIIRNTASVRTLFRISADGQTFTPIATASTTNPPGGVRGFAFFTPAINNHGAVAFRATEVSSIDPSSTDAVFIGDGTNLLKVVGERMQVPADIGLAQIGQETLSSPAFAGGIALNDRNQVAFTAGVHPDGNNQIEWGTAIYVANPIIRGDFDRDLEVDVADIDLLLQAVQGPVPPAEPRFDLNSDAVVSAAPNGPASDLDVFVRDIKQTEYADANLNGRVEFDDLLITAKNFGFAVTSWGRGDFDGDGVVGFPDLLLLAQNYGFGTPNLTQTHFDADWQHAASMVPEPGCILLAATAFIGIARRRTQA